MKKVKILIGMCVVVFVVFCGQMVIAQQDVTESPLDFVEVMTKWDLKGTASMAGFPLGCFINPDIKAKIRYVTISSYPNFMGYYPDSVIAYTFLLDNMIHLYFRDPETRKFSEKDLDQGNWQTTYQMLFDIIIED